MHAFDCDVYQVKCVKFCIRFSVWFMYCNGKCVLKSVKLKMPAILVLWLGVTVEWRIKMVSLVIWAILNRFLLKFKIAYIKFNRLHYTTFLHLSLSHFFLVSRLNINTIHLFSVCKINDDIYMDISLKYEHKYT